MKEMNSSVNGSFKEDSVIQNVQNDLEFKIIRGELAPGEQFPPIREISESYTIGTSTAQKIVNSLSAEGIIVKKRGVGFFVKPFVKTKLMEKHISKCKKMFKVAIDYAVRLGLDSQAIVAEILEEEKE